MECNKPTWAYDTGCKTLKGNMSYYLDLGHEAEDNGDLYIGRIDQLAIENGCFKKQLSKNKSLVVRYSPQYIDIRNGLVYLINKVKVPCGHCPACQINKASEWATKLYCEAQTNNFYYFTTLTYNDESYRSDRDFRDDITKFIKRLRAKNNDQKLKYFYSFEYGEHTQRGHFHIIIYFKDHQPKDKLEFLKKNQGHNYFSSQMISDTWTYGYNVTCPKDDDISTLNYVARYCVKKAGDDKGFIGFSKSGQGLGAEYIKEIAPSKTDTNLLIHSYRKTTIKKIPKHYRELISEINPVLSDKIEQSIKQFIYAKYKAPKGKYDTIPTEYERTKAQMRDTIAQITTKYHKL